MICEANESRDKDACQLNEHVEYVVGGEKVSLEAISYIAGAGEYLKRKTCINVGIPDGAKSVTIRELVVAIGGGSLTEQDKIRLAGPEAVYRPLPLVQLNVSCLVL